MIDRVARGSQPPVTPHDEALQDFVDDLRAIYPLNEADEMKLLDMMGHFVSIVGLNALARQPRIEAAPSEPQGVKDGPEFMRVEEVSVSLGIPASTLGGMRRNGAGPRFKKEGRSVLYYRVSVRAYSKGEQEPVQTAQPGNGSEDPSEIRHDA